MRSRKAPLVLKSLPHRPAPTEVMLSQGYNGHQKMSEDFAALRAEIEAEGLLKPSMVEVTRRLLELVVMHAVGAYLVLACGGGPLALLAGVLVLGIVQGRCGWLMHEGGHYSLTGRIPLDRAMQVFLYGFGCGMSAAWWRVQHNKHHATPQKLQHDVDLDTLPLVAFNARIAERVRSPLLKTWLRYQSILFIPVSCLLVALGWQFFLHPRHMVRTRRYGELASVSLRLVAFFGGLCHGLPWGQAVLLYLAYVAVGAAYIFTNFALSHTHMAVSEADEHLHWIEYAAKHTTNITSGPFGFTDWWMAYLNFQIEHHLFASMPQFRHPLIRNRVKALFARNNLPYHEKGYFEALWVTLNNLHDVGQVAATKAAKAE